MLNEASYCFLGCCLQAAGYCIIVVMAGYRFVANFAWNFLVRKFWYCSNT